MAYGHMAMTKLSCPRSKVKFHHSRFISNSWISAKSYPVLIQRQQKALILSHFTLQVQLLFLDVEKTELDSAMRVSLLYFLTFMLNDSQGIYAKRGALLFKAEKNKVLKRKSGSVALLSVRSFISHRHKKRFGSKEIRCYTQPIRFEQREATLKSVKTQ
jgi:hypothetical protein